MDAPSELNRHSAGWPAVDETNNKPLSCAEGKIIPSMYLIQYKVGLLGAKMFQINFADSMGDKHGPSPQHKDMDSGSENMALRKILVFGHKREDVRGEEYYLLGYNAV
jgi:hypothetical protein